MTLLAVTCAALAGWLAVGHRPDRLGRRTTVGDFRRGRGGGVVSRGPRVGGALVGLAVAVAVSTLGAGPGSGALAGAVGITGLTAGQLMISQLSSKRVTRRRREVARAASSLSVQLQAGLVVTEALQNAAVDWEVLRRGAAAHHLGGDPTDVWLEQSRSPGWRGLAHLARGWRLCVRSGAPLAPTLQQISAALEAEEALGLTVAAELAAPRATGRIMAVLPLVGLGLGFAMGGDPVHFLLDTWPGRACLVAGAVLASAGVAWIERIAGQVASRL